MTKTLEGYIDNGKAAPLPGISAVVTVVGDGAVVASGMSDTNGHWHFDGLADGPEYFVNLVDGQGNAIVRGPWSGEVRDVWVRDRLAMAPTGSVVLPAGANVTVEDLPLVVDPAVGNTLQWGAAGLYVPPIPPGVDAYTKAESDARYPLATAPDPYPIYLTQAEADLRYLQLTGGTLTGLLTTQAITLTGNIVPSTNVVRNLGSAALQMNNLYAQSGLFSGTGTPNPNWPVTGAVRLRNGTPGNITWRNAANTADLLLGVDTSNVLTWGGSPVITEVTGDARYAPIGGGGMTEAEADLRYLQLTGGTLTGTLTARQITPAANVTYDLGMSATRWNALWGYAADLTGYLRLHPTTASPDVIQVWAGSDGQYRFILRTDGQMKWGSGSLIPDVTLERSAVATLKLTGNLNFGNATNQQHITSTSDIAWLFYNTAPGYNRIIWQRKQASALTIHDADANRDLFTVAQNTGNAAIYGTLTVAALPVAISPDAANIVEWRANGFYAAAGAVTDIWVNTTGDTMTGDLQVGASPAALQTQVASKRVWINPTNLTPTGYVASAGLTIQSDEDSSPGREMIQLYKGGAWGGRTGFYNSRGTVAAPAANSVNDEMFRLTFYGRGSSAYGAAAGLDAYVDAAAANVVQGRLRFLTSDGGGTLVERARIDSTGALTAYWGLKTDSTDARLEFRESNAPADQRRLLFLMPSDDGRLRIQTVNDSGGWGTNYIDLIRSGNTLTDLTLNGVRLTVTTPGINVGTAAWAAWGATQRVAQFGQAGAITGRSDATLLSIGSNWYSDGVSNRAVVTGGASLLNIDAGVFYFYTAPSVAAGAVQAFASQDTIGHNIRGFFGTAAVAKQTVSGSRAGNAALTSLLTALAAYGLIVNSSSA